MPSAVNTNFFYDWTAAGSKIGDGRPAGVGLSAAEGGGGGGGRGESGGVDDGEISGCGGESVPGRDDGNGSRSSGRLQIRPSSDRCSRIMS
jgi:hypothetical protein